MQTFCSTFFLTPTVTQQETSPGKSVCGIVNTCRCVKKLQRPQGNCKREQIGAACGVNPKGAGRKGALLLDVYGDLTPKEKCTCRVRAHGGGWRDAACADVASRAGATVDGHYSSYNFEQWVIRWVNGDGG